MASERRLMVISDSTKSPDLLPSLEGGHAPLKVEDSDRVGRQRSHLRRDIWRAHLHWRVDLLGSYHFGQVEEIPGLTWSHQPACPSSKAGADSPESEKEDNRA